MCRTGRTSWSASGPGGGPPAISKLACARRLPACRPASRCGTIGYPYERRLDPALLHVAAAHHGNGAVGIRSGIQDRRQDVCRGAAGAGPRGALVQVLAGGLRRVDRAPGHHPGALPGQGAMGRPAERGCADRRLTEAAIETRLRPDLREAAPEDASRAAREPGTGSPPVTGKRRRRDAEKTAEEDQKGMMAFCEGGAFGETPSLNYRILFAASACERLCFLRAPISGSNATRTRAQLKSQFPLLCVSSASQRLCGSSRIASFV